MKRTFFRSVLVLVAVTGLFGQEELLSVTDREVPPAPVVSQLQAVSTGNSVRLSWVQAPDVDGESIILRANRPITAGNYLSATRIGTVACTVTTFIDTVTDNQVYFYAILSKDSNGTLYDFFLPVSNSLLLGISTGVGEITVKETRFSAFDTMNRNDAIIITWKSSVEGKNLVLYRSTSAFTSMNSLVQAVVVSGFADTGVPYVDYPVPGVPYYYAIIDEDSIHSGTASFNPDENTNRIPVEIPSGFAKFQRAGLPGLRPMPLPYLNPSQTAPVASWQFSPKTEKMIRALTAGTVSQRHITRTPYIFLSDSQSKSGGEEFTLKKILETNFPGGKWAEAITDLTQFLSLRRTPETAGRTHFYLGEAYYFNGNYPRALPEFLLSQDLYYNQSREWIRYVLEKMINTPPAPQKL